MLTKIAFALFAVIAACASCATVKPIETKAVEKVTEEVDCTLPKVEAQIPAILAEVNTDLTPIEQQTVYDKLGALAVSLAKSLGEHLATDVLVCAVQASTASAADRMAATPGAQPNAERIRANAAAYLKARDVHFAAAPMAATGPVCLPACPPPGVCRYVPPNLHGICFR